MAATNGPTGRDSSGNEQICHGVDVDFDGSGQPHKPTRMESVENSVGEMQWLCPECGVLIE